MIGASKLSEQDVLSIRTLSREGLKDNEIAKMYGVSRPHINCIKNGRRWNEHNRSFYMKETLERLNTPKPTETLVFDEQRQTPTTPKKNFFKKCCAKIGLYFLSLSL